MPRQPRPSHPCQAHRLAPEAAREDVPDSPVPPSLGPGRPELQLKGSSGFSAPAHAPGGTCPRPVGGSPGVLQSQQEALPRADFLEEGAQLGTPTRTKPQTNSPPVPSLKLPSDLQILSLELEAVCAPTSSSGAPLGPFSSITKHPHRSYLHPRLPAEPPNERQARPRSGEYSLRTACRARTPSGPHLLARQTGQAQVRAREGGAGV